MKNLFLLSAGLMTAFCLCFQAAAQEKPAAANETTASKENASSNQQVKDAFPAESNIALVNAANKLAASENNENPPSQPPGEPQSIVARGDGELCASGECYKNRAEGDFCRNIAGGCHFPSGIVSQPTNDGRPAGSYK